MNLLMKNRLAFVFAFLICALGVSAQFTGNGYYRVHNKATSRYIYVLDNTGRINLQTASADMGAIELYKDTARLHHDPATVIYARLVSAGKYDLEAQGTGVHQIIGYYVDVYQMSDGSYQVYAEGKYLDDNETSDRDLGFLGTERTGDYRRWYINAMDQASNYFGILPTIQLGDKYYKPFYAAFPFSFASTGMKAYYIKQVHRNAAILQEVTGVIPAATPVFIECSSAQQWHNKLQIAPAGTPASLPGNLLRGVYFNNPNRCKSADARTANNPVTMRTLAVSADGRLCFVKKSSQALPYMPANEAYLSVPSTVADTLFVMTEEEYRLYSIASSLSLSASSLTLHPAESTTLSATILPTTAEVTVPAWTSSDTSVVKITVDAYGRCVCTAVGVGTAQVIASTTDGSLLQAQCSVTVLPNLATGISLSSPMLSGVEGDVFTLTATVVPSNVTNGAVTWMSSNPQVATVDHGVVTIVGVGTATITASTTDGTQLSASCSVIGNAVKVTSVSLSSALSPSDSLSVGDTLRLIPTVLPANATSKSLRWASSRASCVSVTSDGLCQALSAGTAIISATATDGSRVSAQYTINVRPILATSVSLSQDTVNLSVGDAIQFNCRVLPSNVSNKSVLWSVDNPSVASVSPMGYVSVFAPGQATVTVSTVDGSNLSASCVLLVADTVVPPTLATSLQLSTSSAPLQENEQIRLVLEDSLLLSALVLPMETTDKSVVWSSSDSSVLRIDVTEEGACRCYACGLGTAQVTVSTLDGSLLSAHCTITVDPVLAEQLLLQQADTSLIIGDSIQVSATILPLNTTDTSLLWTVSDSSVVRIIAEGGVCRCFAVGVGMATVGVATVDGSSLSESFTLLVMPRMAESVLLTMADGAPLPETGLVLTLADSLSLHAEVLPVEATNRAVLWESSDPMVVSVDAQGQCYAAGLGNAVVRVSAVDGSGAYAECELTVDPVWVTSVTLSADSLSLYENESATLVATVLPENATFRMVDFLSSDESVLTVSADGLVVGLKEGEAYVEALAQDGSGVSARCSVRVVLFTGLMQQLRDNPSAFAIYDLQGRKLSSVPCSGFYVINGEVVYVVR